MTNGKFQMEYPYPACNTGCTCTLRLSIVPPQGYTPVSASAPSPSGVESSTVITYPLVTATTSYTSIFFNLSGSTPPTPAAIQRSYYQFSGRRLALRVSGSPVASENGVFFFMNDHLGGSNVTLKYVTGGLSKVCELRYKAWGESRAADFDDTTTPTDLRFTGQRLYEGLGLYHYGARVYDPALGRFLSPDTIVPGQDAAAWDRYAYALENPVRYSDPSGHVAVEHAGFGGGCCSTRPQDKARYQRAYDYWYRLSNSNSHGAIREYYLTRAAQYVALMNQEPENYETASIMSTVTLIRAILNGYRGTDAALETGLSAGAPLMIGFSSWSVSTVGIGYINTIGNSPYGNSAPMSVIRTIQRGESVANILDELKSLTFASDSEYAVVRLADGTRAIVSGGREGIDLSPNVNRIIIHTHPYSISALDRLT